MLRAGAASGIAALTLSIDTGDGRGGVLDALQLITGTTNTSDATNMTSVVGRVNTTIVSGVVTITEEMLDASTPLAEAQSTKMVIRGFKWL